MSLIAILFSKEDTGIFKFLFCNNNKILKSSLWSPLQPYSQHLLPLPSQHMQKMKPTNESTALQILAGLASQPKFVATTDLVPWFPWTLYWASDVPKSSEKSSCFGDPPCRDASQPISLDGTSKVGITALGNPCKILGTEIYRWEKKNSNKRKTCKIKGYDFAW